MKYYLAEVEHETTAKMMMMMMMLKMLLNVLFDCVGCGKGDFFSLGFLELPGKWSFTIYLRMS